MIKRLMIKRFLGEERGTTMVEYAVLTMVITVVLIVAVTAIGGDLTGIFEEAAAGFS